MQAICGRISGSRGVAASRIREIPKAGTATRATTPPADLTTDMTSAPEIRSIRDGVELAIQHVGSALGEPGGRGIRSNPMSLTPLPPGSPANSLPARDRKPLQSGSRSKES